MIHSYQSFQPGKPPAGGRLTFGERKIMHSKSTGRLLAALGLTLALSSNAWALIGAGKAAPAWSGKTLAGQKIASGQFKGKVVLMNFFSYG
jgi:hypothetical protein